MGFMWYDGGVCDVILKQTGAREVSVWVASSTELLWSGIVYKYKMRGKG